VNWIVVPLALLTACSTLAGGYVALRLSHELQTVIALTGGVVVAVAFFLAERALVLHHRDDTEHARAHAQVGALGAAGLSIHSFIDGLGIGIAFNIDTATGFLVFFAVIAHDFADGMNTVSFVLRQGSDRARALRWLAVDAVAPVVGAIVGTSLNISEENLGELLAVYVGFFLFMGATDLLPHAHEHPSGKRVALTFVGFAFIFALSRVAA
jgi:zinc transporter, ZIP family